MRFSSAFSDATAASSVSPGAHAHLDRQHDLRTHLHGDGIQQLSMSGSPAISARSASCRSSSAERPTIRPLMRMAMKIDTQISTTPMTIEPDGVEHRVAGDRRQRDEHEREHQA